MGWGGWGWRLRKQQWIPALDVVGGKGVEVGIGGVGKDEAVFVQLGC